jgi:hypothetical protein
MRSERMVVGNKKIALMSALHAQELTYSTKIIAQMKATCRANARNNDIHDWLAKYEIQ